MKKNCDIKKIAFLPTEEFAVLKVIQIEGNEWNWFTGYLPYIRNFNPKEYNSLKGDIIDEKILSSLQETLPKSFLKFSEEILFEGQLDERIETLEGGSRKNIIIQFLPLIPYEQAYQFVGRHFTAYPFRFEIRLLFKEGKEKKHHLHEFYSCNIPHDIMDEKIKTIKPI